MAFRRSLPADANFVVSKNTLMKRAVDGTKFEAFGDALKVCGHVSTPNIDMTIIPYWWTQTREKR